MDSQGGPLVRRARRFMCSLRTLAALCPPLVARARGFCGIRKKRMIRTKPTGKAARLVLRIVPG